MNAAWLIWKNSIFIKFKIKNYSKSKIFYSSKRLYKFSKCKIPKPNLDINNKTLCWKSIKIFQKGVFFKKIDLYLKVDIKCK